MGEADWQRVADAEAILAVSPSSLDIDETSLILGPYLPQDSRKVQHYFSSECQPTLWRVLPALEDLQTEWEKKTTDPHFELYHDAIHDGLDKLRKYYNKIDAKPSIILSLGVLLRVCLMSSPHVSPPSTVLHPFFKLDYIEHQWGGAKEQAEARRKGDRYAKNYQDEARKIVEKTVSS
jgi:hypothetical protein